MRSEPGADATAGSGSASPSLASATPPRRLHVVTPLFLLVKQARSLIPLFAIALFQRRALLIVLVVLLVMASVVLRWWRRTWQLDGRTLRVEEGVFGRRVRVVPFDRIQQVTLHRKLVHRLLGVATLRVETAGGAGGSEVDLDVISMAEAGHLREVLLAARSAATTGQADVGPAPAPAPAPAERVVVRLGVREVILAGVTGARAAAALAVLGPLFQYADDFHLFQSLTDRIDPERVLGLGPLAITVAAVGAVALWFAVAAGASLLTDFGFTMSLRGDDLVVRRGLLERREAVVPRARVQVVRLDESLLRRALGLGTVRVFSAGRSGRNDRQADRVAVPVLPTRRYAEVLEAIMPGSAPIPALIRPPAAARRRQVTRRVVATLGPITAAVVVSLLIGNPVLGPGVAVALLAAAVLLGLAAWRGMGHELRPGSFLYARYGVLIRSTVIVPLSKAQSCRVLATPFQRRAGLATLHVDVAGSGVDPRVIDERGGRALELLHAVLAPGGREAGRERIATS
jgi:putative membrane protein